MKLSLRASFEASEIKCLQRRILYAREKPPCAELFAEKTSKTHTGKVSVGRQIIVPASVKNWRSHMTKMVVTKDGFFVLRSEITSIRKHVKKSNECEILTKHGKSYVVEQGAKELANEIEFEEEAIPAEPGYFVLFMDEPSRRLKDFQKVPVVGWMKFRPTGKAFAPDVSAFSLPILPGGCGLRALGIELDHVGIVLPDGRVIDTRNLREYKSVKTFVKERVEIFSITKSN
jgi:hypothetical protein